MYAIVIGQLSASYQLSRSLSLALSLPSVYLSLSHHHLCLSFCRCVST
jgi:hypothetical protein